jgi:hypothetical protein
VIQELVAGGRARVQVLEAGHQWFGLTHPSDRELVRSSLYRLIAEGAYPERLWH